MDSIQSYGPQPESHLFCGHCAQHGKLAPIFFSIMMQIYICPFCFQKVTAEDFYNWTSAATISNQ